MHPMQLGSRILSVGLSTNHRTYTTQLPSTMAQPLGTRCPLSLFRTIIGRGGRTLMWCVHAFWNCNVTFNRTRELFWPVGSPATAPALGRTASQHASALIALMHLCPCRLRAVQPAATGRADIRLRQGRLLTPPLGPLRAALRY